VSETPPTSETFRQFGAKFIELGRPSKRSANYRRNKQAMIGQLCEFTRNGEPLGDKPIETINESDFEAFVRHQRWMGRAASTRNHYLQCIRTLSAWGVKTGALARPWIRPNVEIRQDADSDLRREPFARRSRRLAPDEEQLLLHASSPHLQRLILAALETGCRRGELLSLQWREVSLERRTIRLLASKTKSKKDRELPISDRLFALLQMGRHDPAGQVVGPDAFVFGNELGEPSTTFKTAWYAATRRASIKNLRFHDLRHEAGSRFLEAGWPLSHVRQMLGHANIATTDTYLNASLKGLQDSMRRYDEGRMCKKFASSPSGESQVDRQNEEHTTDNSLIN
jgi:integrase